MHDFCVQILFLKTIMHNIGFLHLVNVHAILKFYLSEKVHFVCTTSPHTDFYQQQVSLVETHHLWENVHILFMQILLDSHENLLPIGWKPSY